MAHSQNLVHPKGVWWGWGQEDLRSRKNIPQQAQKNISLWIWLCAWRGCHGETRAILPVNCFHRGGGTKMPQTAVHTDYFPFTYPLID